MNLYKTVTLLVLLHGGMILAQDLTLEVLGIPAETPQYMSDVATIFLKNTSNHPVKLALGENGLTLDFTVHDSNGNIVVPDDQTFIDGSPIPGAALKFLVPGERYLWRKDVLDAKRPGDYTIEIAVSSKGPYKLRRDMPPTIPPALWNKHLGEEDRPGSPAIWTGEIRLPKITLRVIEAKGEDRAAWDYFTSIRNRDQSIGVNAVIDKYPHSIYAATFLVQSGLHGSSKTLYALESAAKATNEERLNSVEGCGVAIVMKMGSTPDEIARRSGHADYRQDRITEGRKHLEKLIKLYRMIEDERPQFAGLARIRWNSAMALYSLNRDQEAEDEVRALAKLQGKEAEEARALMKARNISAEPPKPWWKIW